ncbi:RNA polymerase sigma factor RpoE [Candidatus Paraburkholderia calva]|nr:RNA polymerase sigma factor RpoE [Candidatus Paraburkholderia calva]
MRTARHPASTTRHHKTLNEEDPDTALIARVGNREPGAVREIVALAARSMLGDRDEADDVAQEALLRIWKIAPRWRHGEARFDTWLHRVTLNLCYDRLRKTRETSLTDDMPEEVDNAPLPDERLAAAGTYSRIAQALERLPARQREALVLHYYQDLPNAGATALMGVSGDALESLLARARLNLKIALADLDDDAKESRRHPNDSAASPRLTGRRPSAGRPPSARRRSRCWRRPRRPLDTHAVAATRGTAVLAASAHLVFGRKLHRGGCGGHRGGRAGRVAARARAGAACRA